MSVQILSVPEHADLDDLARRIWNEHRLVSETMSSALEHAINAGELLLEAKSLVQFGEWEKWLSDRCVEWNLSLEWARSYMRIARNQDLVRREGLTTLGAVRKHLTVANVADVRVDPLLRQEAIDLREEGLSQTEIALRLGVSSSTITRWLDPAKEAKYKRHQARTTRQARAAHKREQNKKAAREIGGGLAEGYSLVRKCLDALERAATEHDAEVRREVRSAMNSLYNAEDSISQALRLAGRNQ